jgi:cyclic pyranopterin phosphate synthase
VATPPVEAAVYSFEGLLPELESPPIAARRALDHAGYRLSVEGWRSLSTDERQKLTHAGVPDRVDVDLVAGLLRRASPAAQKISPASDPDPSAPPEALARALEPGRAIDPKRWARLRAVDRYALAHTYRRAVARSAFSLLGEAFDAVLAAASAVAYEPPPVSAARTGGSGAESPSRTGRQTQGSVAPSPAPPAPGAYQPAGYYSSVVTPPETREAVPGSPPVRPTSSAPHETPTQPRAVVLAEAAAGSARGSASSPPSAGALSNHLNAAGEVHMIDVARKPETERRAIACGSVLMRPDTLGRLVSREVPKGEVLATARIAAILAAKRTHELIPLCHAVALTHVEVLLDVDAPAAAVHVTAVVDAYDRTGCEMEAMVAVSTACLTVYDMLKGIDRDMVIGDVKLIEKSGGRSGHYRRGEVKP